ncbi:MAG: protein kinase [Planctomycetota bacterium]
MAHLGETPDAAQDFIALERAFTLAVDLGAAERERFVAAHFAGRPDLQEQLRRLLRCDLTLEGLVRGVGLEAHALIEAHRPPQTIVGYELGEELGRGGMSVVYAAEQLEPRRPVALKVIRGRPGRPLDPALLLREAHVLARLDHPGIARVFATGRTADGEPFVAMERIDGVHFDRFVHDEGCDRRRRVELLRAVCSAVGHAHHRGIVHRDLKPSNVLVTPEGVVKVVDFGIARILDLASEPEAASTSSSDRAGTPHWMSPEQVRGDLDAIDARSDVFSLGRLAYEVLLGDLADRSHPDPGQPPPPLAQVDRTLRGDLDAIVAKALSADPAGRYADADALGDDLARHQSWQPVTARPPRTAYVWGRFVRRHRLAVGALVVVVLSLGIGLGAALVALGEARASEARASAARDAATAEADVANELAGRLEDVLNIGKTWRLSPAVRFADVLALMRDRLEQDVPHRPSVAFRMQAALARALHTVAKGQEAVAAFDRALMLALDAHLPPSLTRLVEVDRMRTLIDLGLHDDAIASASKFLDDASAPVGDHTLRIEAHNVRTEALTGLRRLDEAEAALDRLEAFDAEVADPADHRLLTRLVILRRADLANVRGDTDTARRLADELVNGNAELPPWPGDERAWYVLRGWLRRLTEMPEQAQPKERMSPRELAAMSRSFLRAGKPADAEARAREAMTALEQAGETSSQAYRAAESVLSTALARQARWQEALPITERLLREVSAVRGADDRDTRQIQVDLFIVLDALEAWDRIVADTEAGLPVVDALKNAWSLQSRYYLLRGRALCQLDRLDEAERCLSHAQELLAAHGQKSKPLTEAMNLLAERRARAK